MVVGHFLSWVLPSGLGSEMCVLACVQRWGAGEKLAPHHELQGVQAPGSRLVRPL